MLMKASKTGQSISRVLVQTADWHYKEAMEWYDMYQHFVTEGATFLEDGKEIAVPDGLIHPDFWLYAKRYLARYHYHIGIADTIMATGKGVISGDWFKIRSKPVDYANEFEKAVEQRGQQAKEDFLQRRKKAYVQRKKATKTDRENPVETVH